MKWLGDLNLIHCLAWYLVAIFLVGTVLRLHQYRALLGVLWSVPGRWPRLLQLVKQHRGLFLTWTTFLPSLLALVLSLVHMLACRLVWPQADLSLTQLLHTWLAMLVVCCLGLCMVGLDCYSAVWVRAWDRGQVEKQFDQAEYWLGSWSSPAVRVVTLGWVNPRKLVGVEIHKALIAASRQLNLSLWWSSLQISFRIAFGAALWLTYTWNR